MFAFETVPGRGIYADTTRWRYELERTVMGTLVTESYDFDAPMRLKVLDLVLGRRIALRRGMRRTLEALRRRAEAPG